jgi:hypothetical protein
MGVKIDDALGVGVALSLMRSGTSDMGIQDVLEKQDGVGEAEGVSSSLASSPKWL